MNVADQLAARHPQLFHLTDSANLGSIHRHGLLSTAALLDLHQITGHRRRELERARRPGRVRLEHPERGEAVLRDNLPSLDAVLARCLIDMSIADWYMTLNRRVFFWTSRARAERLAAARGNRGADQRMMVLDTASLLARHAGRAEYSHINSGATYARNPATRGPTTFIPITQSAGAATTARGGRTRPIVELTILGAVPDIREHLIAVEPALPGEMVDQRSRVTSSLGREQQMSTASGAGRSSGSGS